MYIVSNFGRTNPIFSSHWSDLGKIGLTRWAAVESMIDGDPVASSVREIMVQRKTWIGTAADLLRFGGEYSDRAILMNTTGLPKSPRALAGRLRRARPGLRSLGIE